MTLHGFKRGLKRGHPIRGPGSMRCNFATPATAAKVWLDETADKRFDGKLEDWLVAARAWIDDDTGLVPAIDGSRAVLCGRGGAGDVYKLVDISMGCLAVKQIRCTSEQGRPRDLLLNEVKIALALEHKYILPVFGVVQMLDSPAWCLVTPWQDLGTLGSFTKRHPSANRAKLLSQTASALAYLHGRTPPIIHSDLHIENVFINSTGDAQLADFGLSKVFDAAAEQDPGSSRSAYPGVLVYQAPELHDGERRTTATDVFAFGMLVVHAYSGQRPLVSAKNDVAIIIALSQGMRPQRAEVARDDFCDVMWEQAQACWAQDPAARPAMSSVHAHLEPTVQPDNRVPAEGAAESSWLLRQEKERFAAESKSNPFDPIWSRIGASNVHLS